MVIPLIDDTIGEFKRLEALLESAVMHGDDDSTRSDVASMIHGITDFLVKHMR